MKNKRLLIILLIFTWLPIIYIMYTKSNNYNNFKNNLKPITIKSNIDIKVHEAFNDRGLFIINDSFSISSNTPVIYSSFQIKDPAIWRSESAVFKPTISDVFPPYNLVKGANSDTISLFMRLDTIVLLQKKRK